MALAYVSVGSNLSPEKMIAEAMRLLLAEGLEAVSTVYRTEPVGPEGQARFLNCVVRLATERPPLELKGVLKAVEARLGRERGAGRYAPRCMDLDLVAYGELRLAEGGLELPDPDIENRPFIAIPLSELAPDLATPSGRSVRSVAEAMPPAGMEPLHEYTTRVRAEVLRGK